MSAERSVEAGELLKRAGRDDRLRVQHAAADLAVSDAERLSERQRAHTLYVLRELFGAIEDVLRRSFALGLSGAGAAGREAAADLTAGETGRIWARVEAAVLSPPFDLLDHALLRAAEHALASPLRAAAPADGGLARLVAQHSDTQLSQRAMDLVVADSRRQDGFGEPRLAFDELDEDCAVWTAWLAGAALAAHVRAARPVDEATLDGVTEQSVRRLLAERGQGGARPAGRLAARLETLGALDDDLLASLAEEGQLPLLAASLARRAGIGAALAMRLLLAGDDSGLLVLLRALDLPGKTALAIITVATLGSDDPTPGNARVSQLANIPLADARRQLARWRRDPLYVRAISALRSPQ